MRATKNTLALKQFQSQKVKERIGFDVFGFEGQSFLFWPSYEGRFKTWNFLHELRFDLGHPQTIGVRVRVTLSAQIPWSLRAPKEEQVLRYFYESQIQEAHPETPSSQS